MNSVAPDTKRAAAAAIEAAGGRYVDVAVMAPVHPRGRAVPLLVCGPHAEAARRALARCGFAQCPDRRRAASARASAIKMIRSVMVKGIEALTAECALAAEAAGVRDEVIASLDASWPGADWAERVDYNLDRMMIHGLRRAAEMEEVVEDARRARHRRGDDPRHDRAPAGDRRARPSAARRARRQTASAAALDAHGESRMT